MKNIVILLIFLPITVWGSSFEVAIPLILKHEGLYINDPADRGGITKYGISLRYLRELLKMRPDLKDELDINKDGVIDGYDILHMSKEEATELYQKEWWEQYGYGRIDYQPLATKVFDLAVNMGNEDAVELLQTAYNKFHGGYYLVVDGMLGDDTIDCANQLERAESVKLLRILKQLAVKRYVHLSQVHPSYKKFLIGWVRRAND